LGGGLRSIGGSDEGWSICGRENADNRDFCECGEYLRWEPTQGPNPSGGGPPAVSGAADSKPEPAPLDLDVTRAPGGAAADSSPRPSSDDASRPAEGSATPSAAAHAPPGAATLLLRLPEDDGAASGPVMIAVKPGERATVLGLIRNESGIVDNYDIAVTGLPEGWWTVTPPTTYLVPLGTSGRYEQEIQIHLHPPRSPEAQARAWSFEVVAFSRTYETQVAGAAASVQIQPYRELASKLAPDRASGRLKARFVLTVRNRANARADVLLSAEDADGECEFRFAQPSVAVEPGQGIEAPFTVFPPKQIWIGRPLDRPIRVTATPAGVDTPQPPLPAVYRQRPWLPWWLAIVAPIAAALLVLFLLLAPKQTVMPNLTQAKSVFDAERLVLAAGLHPIPHVVPVSTPKARPGSIVAQIPSAGKQVKRGGLAIIKLATGPGMVKVPPLKGSTPATAYTTLSAKRLVLGAVSPAPPNPDGTIATQLPKAGDEVSPDTMVAVFLEPPVSANTGTTSGQGGQGPAKTGTSGAGAGKTIKIPDVNREMSLGAAQQLSQLGLVPQTIEQFDKSTPGTLIGTNPRAGTPVPAGTHVTVIVSAGYPQLSYDDGTSISVINPATSKPGIPPPASQPVGEASWSSDGRDLVYVQGPQNAGQLVSFAPNQHGATPSMLTAAGTNERDPAFAPNNQVLAFIDRSKGYGRLCFAAVPATSLLNTDDCTSHPGFDLGRQISWSPHGRAILVYGSPIASYGTVHGLIEFRTNEPFSPNAAAWDQGTLVTEPAQDVIAGAFSPDGKHVALVSDFGTPNSSSCSSRHPQFSTLRPRPR
jgi:beta-lactam-binding protein with PASTA domain